MELKNADGLTEKEFLEQYRPGDYEHPSVTVDMLIFAVDSKDEGVDLLLIRRKNHPCIGKWAIPGGFVEMNESLEEAAARELKEETGLEDLCLEQLFAWGDVKRDPRTRVISVSYMSVVPKDQLKPQAGDDAEEAVWFRVKKKKLSDSENGATYALTIENDERSIFIGYRITETYEQKGLMWHRDVQADLLPAIDAPEDEALAFDHVYILNQALDRLEEMEREYRESLI